MLNISLMQTTQDTANSESPIALVVHVGVMILAGFYGGIVNYFLESEKTEARSKLSLWQMVVIGIGAAFLVPLFLTLISSNLVNLKQLEFSKILVFFGFCLIAAISSRRFIMTISERILKEVKEAKNVAAQAQEAIAEKEKQEVIDQEATELVHKVFEDPDPDETPISTEVMKEKIKSASVRTRANIFFEARRFRRDNYRKYPEKIERLVPVFEALIEADKNKIYHRNYSQLGYVLKDKKKKEFERAIDVFSTAIEIRNEVGETGYNVYEFNRAICHIETDPNYKSNKSSSDTVKQTILDDFRQAFQNDRWKNAVERELKSKADTTIPKWFKLNNVDLKSLV